MVLEHLRRPLDVLQKLRSWVRPDGWLVLSVPDAGGLEFRVFGDRWYAFQLPTHLHHFSPETLTRMLTAAGCAVDRTLGHGSATNTLMSLSYRASDRGFSRAADFFRDAAERRRLRATGKALGILLGLLRQSGRITVWARPSYYAALDGDRKSVVAGQRVSVRVDLGGRRIDKTKKRKKK